MDWLTDPQVWLAFPTLVCSAMAPSVRVERLSVRAGRPEPLDHLRQPDAVGPDREMGPA